MSHDDYSVRARISDVVTEALRRLPAVFAGWEGGSAVSLEDLYATAERAIEGVSPITARHTPLKGQYYKLKDGGDFLLVDLIFHRVGDPDHHLDVERHSSAATTTEPRRT